MRNKTKKICPICNYLGRDDADRCPYCGLQLISECPKCCSKITTAFAKHCSMCGYHFAENPEEERILSAGNCKKRNLQPE